MAYQFKKLSEVEALNEIPKNANAFVEANGEIYRVPGEGLGGGGVKTAIIKSSRYDDAVASMKEAGAPMAAELPAETFECGNMTFEEAYAILESGNPLMVFGQIIIDGPACMTGMVLFGGVAMTGKPTIGIEFYTNNSSMFLMWTADGISVPVEPS